MIRRLVPCLILAACLWATLPAVAREGAPPRSFDDLTLKAQTVDRLPLEAIDSVALRADDAARFDKALPGDAPAPVRFALPVDLSVTPKSRGTWTRLDDGWLWRLEVSAPGATDLNFGFTHFGLPRGATLHVLSPADGYYQGPYTGDDMREHGQLWTPVIPGDTGQVELFVPDGAALHQVRLELTRIGRGYRDLFGQGLAGALKQGSCNIDVVCPQRAGWEDQIRSVGVYGTNGSTFCTGTLINNVAEDGRPFFLTANHCNITSSNAASVVVYWNFESPSCGQLAGGSLSDNTSGATLRASDSQNDMSLLELSSVPANAYNVYYAGWDARTSTAPQSSVGIHHPNTDEKAISFNDDPLTTSNSCIGTGGSNTHWEVDNWEQGTTEPGSSGSALFDPATQRVVGYLSGGTASCSNTGGYDCYGKMSVGWSRGLSAWLDPSSTGTRFVDGRENDGSGGGGGGGGATELTNGVPVTGLSGAAGSEQFFTLEVPAGASNLDFEMSGGSGDADLYVRFGEAPTTSTYDCRPYAGGNNESCPVAAPQAGTYHVMIRGYSAFSGVSLLASFDTGGGGGGDGVLENGVPVTGLSGAGGSEQFFTLDVPAGASNLTIQMSGGTGDADLYVRFGAAPTTSTYDCRPYAGGNNESCPVAAPQVGTYHVMIRAYSAFSGVSLVASFDTGGSGDASQTWPNLSDSTGDQQTFTQEITTSSRLVVSMSGGTGDADLYVRFGAAPTTSTWDCRPYAAGNDETCTVDPAQSGTYYIMVRAYSSYSGVTLTTAPE
ncbi:MAG: pre-peptidase C-terminal domain-containing protein [Acidobacteriota bacterium]